MPPARNLTPVAGTGLERSLHAARLAFFAASLCGLCALAAFLFFVLRDQSEANLVVNYQQRPSLANRLTSQHTAVPPAPADSTPRLSPAAENTARVPGGKLQFTLLRSARFESIGPIQVRLLKTNLADHTYDLTGYVGKRTFTHRQVKLHEPVWIGLSRKASPVKFVAETIAESSISGYWTQSERTAPASQKARQHRRTTRFNQ